MAVQDVDLTFEHWHCSLDAQELRKWGSPHFDRKEVGEAIGGIFRSRAANRDAGTLVFPRDLITVSNHAYPEAALVDPVADLELWDEWKQGIREFPYLGRYAPLGIFRQEGKTSSATSVGVIGEVMAGRLAEAVVAPAVLVRVVRRWPDFILFSKAADYGSAFSFVESKAIGPDSLPQSNLCKGRVPFPLFSELAEQAVRQLNADPFVGVWGAFTHVRVIDPMQLDVTLVQFVAGDDKQAQSGPPNVPEAVLRGLAERAVGATVADLPEGLLADFLISPKRSGFRRDIEADIIKKAFQRLHEIVGRELEGAAAISKEDSNPHIEAAVQRLAVLSELPGRKTREARRSEGPAMSFRTIGSAGGQGIFMADLPVADQDLLKLEWRSDWRRAAEPWLIQNGTRVWRAGGALFCVGDPALEGMPVLSRAIADGAAL
jgi:hypothetical protein